MLRKLFHKVLYGIILFLSYLPWGFLYFLSTVSYLLLYYLLRYRRDVVEQNLQLAFPEKDQRIRDQLVKNYFKDFCDHFFETLKLFTISEKRLHSMFDANYELIEQLNKEGKSCYAFLGHQFNWELGNAHIASSLKAYNIVVYQPIVDIFFDGLFKKLRTRFGSVVVRSDKLVRGLYPYRNETYNLMLVADQNPAILEKAYWLPFFNQNVPFFKGPEKGARAGNNPVIFAEFKKIKRGKYQVNLHLLATDPKLLPESSITAMYAAKLEESIRSSPSNYLWSHRRWRHKQEDFVYDDAEKLQQQEAN